jgi:hypothetical protein
MVGIGGGGLIGVARIEKWMSVTIIDLPLKKGDPGMAWHFFRSLAPRRFL